MFVVGRSGRRRGSRTAASVSVGDTDEPNASLATATSTATATAANSRSFVRPITYLSAGSARANYKRRRSSRGKLFQRHFLIDSPTGLTFTLFIARAA